ncbi:MAG: hypothetical protein K8W52_28000 [Deltaproteobacteria bacterium]|nr:hypothetical protein [Deltaproteobacteria bacterium]
MRTLLVLAPAIALVGACSTVALTPNARSFPFDSPTTPAAGQADVQGDVSMVGAVLGPEAVNSDLRYRRALGPRVVVEGEGGVLHVTNDGSGGHRNAYTGRVGVLAHPTDDDDVRTALTAGIGGGIAPVTGGWASVDIGAAIGGSNRWVRPFIGGDLSFNKVVVSDPFEVASPGGNPVALRLPDTFGARATGGVELGPADRTVVLGFSMARMIGLETDRASGDGSAEKPDEIVIALGAGVRIGL